MAKRGGSFFGYLLLLIAGLIIGSIIGGEIVRRIYTGSNSFKDLISNDGSDIKNVSTIHTSDISGSRNSAIVNATRMVEYSVVGIVVTHLEVVGASYYDHDFFSRFFGPRLVPKYKEVENMGSGFIIDENGLILTNNHVVEGAKRLFINLANGSQYEGIVVGQDPFSDIAVVKIQKEGVKFPAVRFGNSADMMIGEWVIAIGNPFLNFFNDAQPTVTVGVVSALNRNFAPAENVFYQNMIQTDAAINPGNSGGPLVNALGEVVGVNAFIYTGGTGSKGSIGIGFAIPSNSARKIAHELIQYGRRRQVWTGISVKNIDRKIAFSLGLEEAEGVLVARLQKGSPGYKAGLKVNDVVVGMGNRKIRSHEDLEGFFLNYFPGDKIIVDYVRGNKTKNTTMVLEEFSQGILK